MPITALAHNLTRRRFLAWGSAGAAAATAGGLTTRLAFATPDNPAVGDVLVVVFLRGGADGLSLIPTYGDADYFALRPGMRVVSDIKIGRRSILDYVMNPITRVIGESLREP